MDIALHLVSTAVDSSTTNGKRMCSILILLDLLHKLSECGKKDIVLPDDITMLFQMLCFKPDSHNPPLKLEDLNYLLSFIPDKYYMDVANVLVKFTNDILPSNNLKSIEWLYVVPLIHILKKKIQPFEHPAVTSREIRWNEPCGINVAVFIRNPPQSASR